MRDFPELGAAAPRSSEYVRTGRSSEYGESGDVTYMAARSWDYIKSLPHKAAGNSLAGIAVSGLNMPEKPASAYSVNPEGHDWNKAFNRVESIITRGSDAEVVKVYGLTQKSIAETERKRLNNQIRSFIKGHEKGVALANKDATHERLVGRRAEEYEKALPREVLKARFLALPPKDRMAASRDSGLIEYDEDRLVGLRRGIQVLEKEMDRRGIEKPQAVEAGIDRFEGKTDSTVRRMLLASGDLARMHHENEGRYLLAQAVTGLELPPRDLFPVQHDAVQALIKNGSNEEVIEADRATKVAKSNFEGNLLAEQIGVFHDKATDKKGAPLDEAERLAVSISVEKMSLQDRRKDTDNIGLKGDGMIRIMGLNNAETLLKVEMAARGLQREPAIGQSFIRSQVLASDAAPDRIKNTQQQIQALAAAAQQM